MWTVSRRYKKTVLRALRLSLHWKLILLQQFHQWNTLCPKMNLPQVRFLPPYRILAIPCPERADSRSLDATQVGAIHCPTVYIYNIQIYIQIYTMSKGPWIPGICYCFPTWKPSRPNLKQNKQKKNWQGTDNYKTAVFHGFLNLWRTHILPLRWQAAVALHDSSIKPNPSQIIPHAKQWKIMVKTTIKRTNSKMQPGAMNISVSLITMLLLLYSWKIFFIKSRIKSKQDQVQGL